MIIYLDACSVCRPFDDISVIRNKLEADAIIEILYGIKNRRYIWKRSEVLDVELKEIKNIEKRVKIQNTYSHIPTQILYDKKVKSLLTKVNKFGFDLMDALHVCSAMIAKCEIFISTDDDLVKKGQHYSLELNLKFYNPLDFIEIERGIK